MPYINPTQALLFPCRRNVNFCLMHSLNRQKLYFSRSLERVQHAPCGVRHVSKRLFLGVTAFSTAVVWKNVHQGKVMGTAQE